LPSWIPGSYLLREFARHVISIRAESAGRALAIEKISKSSWRCRGAAAELVVTIEVYAFDLSVRGAYLDDTRSFFNGTCLFLSPQGREHEPVELLLELPEDPRSANWRVAISMTPVDVDDKGFGRYQAADYDEVIDHPFEISDFAEADFHAGGVPHRLIVAGRHETDLDRVAADLSQLCEAHIEFFGGPPPFADYRFLGVAVGKGYGGLEHRASCIVEPDFFSRRPAETGGAWRAPELPAFSKSLQPRVFSCLERQANQTGRVLAVPSRLPQPHSADVGLRGNHDLLLGSPAVAQRSDRA